MPRSGGGSACSAGKSDGRGISSALFLLLSPLLLLLGDMGVMPCPPRGIACLFLAPHLVSSPKIVAPARPFARISGLALLILRSAVELPGPIQVARCFVRPAGGECVGQLRPVRTIDARQPRIVVRIAVIRILDEEGIILPRLVIIVAFAARQPFDDAIRAVPGPPDPGPGALVIDGVVGRRVGESLCH